MILPSCRDLLVPPLLLLRGGGSGCFLGLRSMKELDVADTSSSEGPSFSIGSVMVLFDV